MTTDTGKRILFRGRIDDLLRLLYPPAHIDDIASEIGCKAEVVPPYADPTDDLNETRADDRPAVDESPFVDDWSLPGYEYEDADIELFERRRNEILAIMKEEPLTKEQANAYIEELAEIQTRLD